MADMQDTTESCLPVSGNSGSTLKQVAENTVCNAASQISFSAQITASGVPSFFGDFLPGNRLV